MIDRPLKEGDKIHAVWYNNGEAGYTTAWRHVKDIIVTMVPGHMANLPFASVFLHDGTNILLPLHNMQEITLDGIHEPKQHDGS